VLIENLGIDFETPHASHPMNDTELDQLLKDCGAAVRLPASFQRDVWSRVAATELTGWKVRMDQIMRRVLGWLALPSVAVTTCAAMVMVGAWLGMTPQPAQASAEIAYIQSVSPFAQSQR
jgi:hypothetical protein